MVLIRSEICAIETPNAAGPIRYRMRRTPSSFGAQSQRGRKPSRLRAGICSASCMTPPMKAPQASASTGGSKYGAATAAARIIATFSSTGVNAGTMKRLKVLRMPPAKATSDMNRM